MLHRRRGSHAGSARVVVLVTGGIAQRFVIVAPRGLPRSLSSSLLLSRRGSGSTSSPREGSVEPLRDDDDSEVGCVPASSSSRRGPGLSSPHEGVGLCARVVGVVSSSSPLPEHTLSVSYRRRCCMAQHDADEAGHVSTPSASCLRKFAVTTWPDTTL